MDPSAFFSSSRVHIVAGKGGVGKTTITAALAVAAAELGLSVLVVDVEGRADLPSLFGAPPLGYEPTMLHPGATGGSVHGRFLSADLALVEHLRVRGLGRLARTMADTGVVDVIARAAPGMKDILVLGKIKQLERAGEVDVILVDAPASGHAVSFLRSPRALLDAVRLGPINDQAQEVLALLGDGERCQVTLVTLPEETPVNEVAETAYDLEEDIGVKLGPIVVNAVYPPRELPSVEEAERLVCARPDGPALVAAARFRRRREALQHEQITRLGAAVPLPQLRTSYRFVPSLGPDDIDALAIELRSGIADWEQLP